VVALAVAGDVAIAPVISGCGAGEEPQTSAPTQLTEGVNTSLPTNRPAAAQIDIRNLFVLGPKPGQTLAQGAAAPLYATIINQVKGRPDKLVSVSSPAFSQAKISGGGLVIPAAAPSGEGAAVKLIGQTVAPGTVPVETPSAKKGKPGASQTPSATGSPVTPGPTGTGEAPSGNPTHESSNTPSAPQQTPNVPEPAGGTGALVVLSGLTQQLVGGEHITLTLQFEQAGSVQVEVPVIPQQGEYETYPAVAANGASPSPSGSASPSTGTTPTPSGSGENSPTPTVKPSQ
jgi:copper(I)-binding protein